MRVASALFYDQTTDQAHVVTRNDGGLRDYCKFVQNLPAEFNLKELSEHALLAMLPDQFDPLLQTAGKDWRAELLPNRPARAHRENENQIWAQPSTHELTRIHRMGQDMWLCVG